MVGVKGEGMYKNILIINLMYIGDLLFITPLLRTLRTNFPKAHIALLADEKNTAVIKYNQHLSELIPIDKKGYHNKFPNFMGLIFDIRKRKFDLVINLHANERASVIAALSGGQKIIGFSAKGFGIFLDNLIKERTDIHQVDAYLEVLKAINVTTIDNQGLEMWVDVATEGRATTIWDTAYCHCEPREAIFPLHADTPKVIGINTGGSWPTKRWTKAGFSQLADKLLEKGYGIAFFGGPMDEKDVNDIISLMKYQHHNKLVVFTGKTTLLEMATLVKKCAVLVTGDSGPMHIAVAQQVPVVAIFGPSDPIRYAPYQQENHVMQRGCPCQPCGKHKCDIGHVCMEEITVEMVLAKLGDLQIE